MEWLNYHHLLYFWTVAREGSVAAASRRLRLAHPTVSAQVHALERALGQPLFTREGRRLVLTETGHLVQGYAEEIFSLGREMVDAVQGRSAGKPLRLRVGISDVLPKLVVKRLLDPAWALGQPMRMVCREGAPDRLLADLSTHQLDVVLTDAPPLSPLPVFGHLLGESSVTFFAAPALARRTRPGFPRSLDGAPILLPAAGSALRQSLESWFDRVGVRPDPVAEFDDAALMMVFGGDGAGLFAGASVMEDDIVRQHRVRIVGRAKGMRERFYAISMERRLQHPAVVEIREAARKRVFGGAAESA